jgi:PAS domain S-box-containing protein
MWVCDAENLRFLAVNRAALEHFGYSREELLALTPKDIRPVEDQEVFVRAILKPMADYVNFGQWRLVAPFEEKRTDPSYGNLPA